MEIIRWLERTRQTADGRPQVLRFAQKRLCRSRMIKMKSYGWGAHHEVPHLNSRAREFQELLNLLSVVLDRKSHVLMEILRY